VTLSVATQIPTDCRIRGVASRRQVPAALRSSRRARSLASCSCTDVEMCAERGSRGRLYRPRRRPSVDWSNPLTTASFKRRQQDSSIRSLQADKSLGPACPLHERTEAIRNVRFMENWMARATGRSWPILLKNPILKLVFAHRHCSMQVALANILWFWIEFLCQTAFKRALVPLSLL